jgi:hypothetical protein
MERLNLDYEELQQVVHLCRWLPPGWDLKRFLLGHLRHRLPATASKIEQFEEGEISALRAHIVAHQQAPRFEPSNN